MCRPDVGPTLSPTWWIRTTPFFGVK
jgi:hypothetical protein